MARHRQETPQSKPTDLPPDVRLTTLQDQGLDPRPQNPELPKLNRPRHSKPEVASCHVTRRWGADEAVWALGTSWVSVECWTFVARVRAGCGADPRLRALRLGLQLYEDILLKFLFGR